MTKNVLILTTSNGVKGDTGDKTGFHWEELTTPYYRFREAGYEVTFGSVKGGRPPADPSSETPESMTDSVKKFQADDAAMTALGKSLPIDQINAGDYDAIFLPGGHGTMWDLAQTDAVGTLIGKAYDNGAIVGAVCHGPAGLVGAKTADGQPLVKGRRVNSFTDAEEEAVGQTDVVPYLLESKLRELGGLFEGNEDNFEPYVVADGRLVTGQNPPSSQGVADQMINIMAQRKAA